MQTFLLSRRCSNGRRSPPRRAIHFETLCGKAFEWLDPCALLLSCARHGRRSSGFLTGVTGEVSTDSFKRESLDCVSYHFRFTIIRTSFIKLPICSPDQVQGRGYTALVKNWLHHRPNNQIFRVFRHCRTMDNSWECIIPARRI